MSPEIKKRPARRSFITTNQPYFKTKLKRLVVSLALRGAIPFALAGWAIRFGGLTHD
jgi:hypothetical protein